MLVSGHGRCHTFSLPPLLVGTTCCTEGERAHASRQRGGGLAPAAWLRLRRKARYGPEALEFGVLAAAFAVASAGRSSLRPVPRLAARREPRCVARASAPFDPCAAPASGAAVDAHGRRHSAVLCASGALLAHLPAATSAETGTPREAIADLASSIPGYGPSDVFYPEWFEGTWRATSELVAVEAPQGDEFAGKPALKLRGTIGSPAAVEKYPQRYVTYRGFIIADRAYNVRGLVRSSGGLESVDWDPSNPNNLTVIVKRDGTSLRTQLKVTKRATGAPEGRESDLFNASEFYQEVVGGDYGSAPKVTPVRCVNKFRRVAGPQIQVLQRIEVFPNPGFDENVRDFGEAVRGGGADRSKPAVVYRYRAILVPEVAA